MTKNEICKCINCNKSILLKETIYSCKDCNKLGICSVCYITGFPYPNICLDCVKIRTNIANKIRENKLIIQKNKENEYIKNLNNNLYNKKIENFFNIY